jgi:hypothetical protein
MTVDTATKYFSLYETIQNAYEAIEHQAAEEFRKGEEEAAARRDAVLNNPNAKQADIDAAVRLYERQVDELEDRYGEIERGARAARDAALDALSEEARRTLARVGRVLLCDEVLAAQASRLLRKVWPPGVSPDPGDPAVLVPVSTMTQFERFLSRDAFYNELLIMTLAIDSTLVINRVGKTLPQLVAELGQRKATVHVDDVVYLWPDTWTLDPAGEEQLRTTLGPGLIRSREARVQSRPTPKCHPPRPWFGPGRDSAAGIFAHLIISADYEQQLKVRRDETLFIDDSTAGNINPKFVRFIIRTNPGLSPALRARLKSTSLPRPDVLLHRPDVQEFEEFKSASPSGISQGRKAVEEYRRWIADFGLPYLPGQRYQPPERIPIFDTTVAGYPIRLYLKPQRISDGLVAYKYCIEADWKALTKTGVIRVVVALILFLLVRRGLPIPPPGGGPPVRLPVPLPDPLPLPPRIPVPANVDVTLSAASLAGLRSIGSGPRAELAGTIDDELLAMFD